MRTNRSEEQVDQDRSLAVVLNEWSMRLIGTDHALQHEIAAGVLGECRRSHLLLDGLSKELQKGQRGEFSNVDWTWAFSP